MGGMTTTEAVRVDLPSILLFDAEEHTLVVQELVHQWARGSSGLPVREALDAACTRVEHFEGN